MFVDQRRQVRELQLGTAQPLGSFVILIAEAVFNIGLAFYFSWKLTLVIVATTPLIALVVGFLGARMQEYVKKQQEQLTEALQRVTSALNAIETVKCFNGQDQELQKYTKTIDNAASWYYRVVNVNAQQFGFTTFMALAMFVQGFYYGGILVDDGQKHIGDVVTTFIAAIGAFNAVAGILPQMIVLEKGRTAGATLRAVMAYMTTDTTMSQAQGLREPDTCDGDIYFQNVSASSCSQTGIVMSHPDCRYRFLSLTRQDPISWPLEISTCSFLAEPLPSSSARAGQAKARLASY